ncbi:PREDICTED: RRP12-like protein [Rhagoletis zephyria]|uniref:RRP12-like protein n=1 Tax=Rhagoletis zephyria TaxID=28612 RepID=UPI00081178F7|nr:PREDICTED: RRP12-like protein [Rhagoletis zephyria]
MEVDHSDETKEEELPATSRKRKATDAISMRSGKTSASKHVAGGKGIHRPLGASGSDAI